MLQRLLLSVDGVPLVSYFVSKDSRGTATLLLLENLRVSVEGDHYDVYTAWFEVLRLVRLLPVLCHATYSDISCTILYIMCIYNI